MPPNTGGRGFQPVDYFQIQHALMREALYLIDQGIASPADVTPSAMP